MKQVAVAALDLIPTMSGSEDLSGCPDRALVTPGLPVDDCPEQLAVHVDPVGELASFQRKSKNLWLNQASFTITISRCLTGASFEGFAYVEPTVEALEAAARQGNADVWALWNGLRNAYRDGLIFEHCDKVVFHPATARNPSGGVGGWTFVIDAVIDGYDPDLTLGT